MTNDLFDSIYTSLPERAKANLCLCFGFSVRIMEADDRIDRKRIRRIANNRPKRRNPMAWDYAENILQLLADLLGLLMCLFFYILWMLLILCVKHIIFRLIKNATHKSILVHSRY